MNIPTALACVTHALSLKKPLVPSPLAAYHFELLGYRLVLLDVTMPEGHGLDSSSSAAVATSRKESTQERSNACSSVPLNTISVQG